MSTYLRPPIEVATYLDAEGRPIPYGERYWGDEDPPDDAYSACVHPDRFAPLVAVGHALVDHLTAAYDVEREDDGDTVTLTPRSGHGTPLTLTCDTSATPLVRLQAGHRVTGVWPECGCDACDEDVLDLVEDLESTVLTIVEGGVSEWRGAGDDVPWTINVRFVGRLETESSGWAAGEPEPLDLPTSPHRWPGWTPRH